jgi:ligand-binding sensor domain-containing protein/two-component sensor histidine kinase
MLCLYLAMLAPKAQATFIIPGNQESESLYFNHITKADGLPSDVVRYIMQDFLGYMWIGTDNGLVQYDGHTMKVFKNNPQDPSTIAENKIYTIFQSSDSLIWIGTVNGFSVYNPMTERFSNFNSNPNNPNQFPQVMVGRFMEDNDGTIWIASSDGLFHYLRPKNEFIRILEFSPDKSSRLSKQSIVYRIAAHPVEKNLIIVTTSGGPLFIDKNTKKVVRDIYYGRTANFEAIPLYLDGDSLLWTASWYEECRLEKFNLKTLEWSLIEVKNIPGLRYIPISDIQKKDDDELWLATIDHGVGIYNKTTGNFSFHRNSVHPKSLMHNHLQSNILIDKSGSIWVGGHKGLNIQDRFFKSFNAIDLPYETGNAHSFFYDKKAGKMYFGTSGQYNVVLWDEIRKKWAFVPHGDDDVKPSAGINCFYKDHKGVIWVGSETNNLLYIDPQSHTLKMFRDKNNQPVTFKPEESRLFYITGDHRQNLWISAQYDGIIKIDAKRENVSYFKHIPGEPNSLINARRYTGLMVDHKNRLFIGTLDGFGMYDIEQGVFMNDYFQGAIDMGLNLVQSNYFAIDTLGRIWVSVFGKGLMRISEDNDDISYKLYQTIHGLNDPGVGQIAVDSKGIFWIINDGLVRFNPYNEQFTVFDEKNGLHSRKMVWNKIYIDAWDNIYLDGIESFETINIAELEVSGGIVNLLIDHVEINGSQILRINPAIQNQPIVFKPSEKNFRFNFSAISFEDAHKIIYEYQLIGFDESPSRVGFQGTANYTNLPPGNYNFVVRAMHRGVWYSSEASVHFIKKPYYYQTFWFIILSISLFLGLILLIIYIRTKQIRAREKIKSDFAKQIAEAEMKSLRAQMNPHFIFNSLNSINTFILKNQTETASDYLTKFSRLIRAVLNNSKNRLVTLEDELGALKIYMELEQLRFNNKFDFEITVDRYLDANRIFVPPLLIQPYVENAIWHGLMYKDGRGRIDIRVNKEDENIRFTVQDNGIGREKAKTYKSSYELKGKSLGMSITADRIATINTLYNCQARVRISDLYDTNQQATGTKVTVVLPIISTI